MKGRSTRNSLFVRVILTLQFAFCLSGRSNADTMCGVDRLGNGRFKCRNISCSDGCKLSFRSIPGALGDVNLPVCDCQCPDDPTVRAIWATTGPIEGYPTTRVFTPTGTWTIEGVGPNPIGFRPEGSMTVAFHYSDTFGLVIATVEDFSLTLGDLGISRLHAPNTIAPFTIIENQESGEFENVFSPAVLLVNQSNGNTLGAMANVNILPNGIFDSVALIDGSLDFASGTWNWTADCSVCSVPEPSTLTLTSIVCVVMSLAYAWCHRKGTRTCIEWRSAPSVERVV